MLSTLKKISCVFLLIHATKASQSAWDTFSQNLWDTDHGTEGNGYSCGMGRTNGDIKLGVRGKYCKFVSPTLLNKPTYRNMINLLDNYEYKIGTSEDDTSQERREVNLFLTSIMDTKVMEDVFQFLSNQGLYDENYSSFKRYLKEIWFTQFPRKGRRFAIDSSAWEHIYRGEVKDQNGRLKGTGGHNLIALCDAEKKNEFDLVKMLNRPTVSSSTPTLTLIRHRLGEENQQGFKGVSTVACGMSPEMEMGLCTACFLRQSRAVDGFWSEDCALKIGGEKLTLKILRYFGSRKGKRALPVPATCYFDA